MHRARFKSAWRSAGRDGKEGRAAPPHGPQARASEKTWVARNKSIRCGERHWQVLNASDQSIDSLTVILFGNGCSLKPGENRAIIAISLGESPSWLRHWILIPACEGSNPSSPAKIYKSPVCLCSRGFFFVFKAAPGSQEKTCTQRFSAAIDRCLCNECAIKPEVAQDPAWKFQVSQGRFHSDPAGAQMYRQTARGFAGAGPMPLCEWRQPRR